MKNLRIIVSKNYANLYIIIFVILSGMLTSQTRTLGVSGSNWTVSVPSITEAGSNYSGTYESASNQILLAVSVPLLLGNGRVSVRYTANPLWNSSLVLNARRTGNGTTGCVGCTISGGTTYQAITLTDVELFRIQAVLAIASYTNIPVQLQLTGVSVTIPAANYNSTVVFTISSI